MFDTGKSNQFTAYTRDAVHTASYTCCLQSTFTAASQLRFTDCIHSTCKEIIMHQAYDDPLFDRLCLPHDRLLLLLQHDLFRYQRDCNLPGSKFDLDEPQPNPMVWTTHSDYSDHTCCATCHVHLTPHLILTDLVTDHLISADLHESCHTQIPRKPVTTNHTICYHDARPITIPVTTLLLPSIAIQLTFTSPITTSASIGISSLLFLHLSHGILDIAQVISLPSQQV